MSQVIKAFMGVFMVLFLMTTSTGVLGAFYQILHAQNTHSVMIDELENSNYAKNVMMTCFDVAKEESYLLQLTLYSDSEPTRICTMSSELPDTTEQISMVEVVLFYDLEIGFFNIAEEMQMFGYAR